MPHTFTKQYIHIVFSTKSRIPRGQRINVKSLTAYAHGIVENLECSILAIHIMPDHLHLLVNLNPSISLADFVMKLKSNLSRWINKDGQNETTFAWQRGYGAFSVSESMVNTVKQYIDRQEEHHKKTSFQEEIAAFLEAHGYEQ